MPFRPCKNQGCPNLVPAHIGTGYCPEHARTPEEKTRESWASLDAKKTTREKSFYSSAAWTKVSYLHRIKEPLCRQCMAAGIVRAGDLTHHDPPLRELLAAGKNPLNDQYLVTVCNEHHMEELRGLKKKYGILQPEKYS